MGGVWGMAKRYKELTGTMAGSRSPGSTTANSTAISAAPTRNGAESFFSRIRRGEIGHYHHVSGPYLLRYGQESAWREDHRRMDNGRQVMAVSGLAMAAPTSVDWCGYSQRGRAAA
jgi:hypothetical protein